MQAAPSKQAEIASSTLAQMRSASCSTHPGRGDEIPTGAEPAATRRPSGLIRAAFEFVVPWSIAKITCPVEVSATYYSSSSRQLFHVSFWRLELTKPRY